MRLLDLPTFSLHGKHGEVSSRPGLHGLIREEVESHVIFEPTGGATRPRVPSPQQADGCRGDHGARLGQNDLVRDAYRLLLVGSTIVVSESGPAGASNRSGVLTIPLLLAELQMARSKRGKPVIVVQLSNDVNWLIVVEGDHAAAMVLMDSFARAGGVRSDFSDALRLNDAPLGNGASAAVHRAYSKNRSNREEDAPFSGMVAKVPLPGANVVARGCLPTEVRHEVTMLSSVQGHPNVVKFYGAFHDKGDATEEGNSSPAWAVVMELCPGGDLFNAVAAGRFSEERSRQVMSGLMSALAHIHSCGIVHRDMKPENVLLKHDMYPVIADLGIACRESDKQEITRRCGTPGYAAPEVLDGRTYGRKADCFSTGSLLFFTICSRTPFDGSNLASILRRTVRCKIDFRVSSSFNAVSDECKHFIMSLLTPTEDTRLSANEALEHLWLVGDHGERERTSLVRERNNQGDECTLLKFAEAELGPLIEAEDDPGLPPHKSTHQAQPPAGLAGLGEAQRDNMEGERMQPLIPAPPSTSKKATAPYHRLRRLANLDQSLVRGADDDVVIHDLADAAGGKMQTECCGNGSTMSTDCPGPSFRESESFSSRPSFRESFNRQFKKLAPRKVVQDHSREQSTPRSAFTPTPAPPQQWETFMGTSETRSLRRLRSTRVAAPSTLGSDADHEAIEI